MRYVHVLVENENTLKLVKLYSRDKKEIQLRKIHLSRTRVTEFTISNSPEIPLGICRVFDPLPITVSLPRRIPLRLEPDSHERPRLRMQQLPQNFCILFDMGFAFFFTTLKANVITMT